MEDRVRELIIVGIAACCVGGVLFLSRGHMRGWADIGGVATSTATQVAASSTIPENEVVTAPFISVQPARIIQGDPVMVAMHATSSLVRMTFGGEPVNVVSYAGSPTGFIGIDINKKAGTYIVKATFANGSTLEKKIVVNARPKVTAPLGIPDSLGGNTPAAATAVVNSLDSDNKVLAALPTASVAYWAPGAGSAASGAATAFHFPVANPVVTDDYGYSRETGAYSIPHKGVDFAAASGTPVMAINTGVVTYAGDLGIYGNTIVVDHGLGIESFYMHLSQVNVQKGNMVRRDQVIGASGETGYAEGPHLHLTVRVDRVSIDPMVFLKFFQK